MELSRGILKELTDYLEDHEVEIANSENDFGDLKNVFKEIVGRWPESGNVYDYVDRKMSD